MSSRQTTWEVKLMEMKKEKKGRSKPPQIISKVRRCTDRSPTVSKPALSLNFL